MTSFLRHLLIPARPLTRESLGSIGLVAILLALAGCGGERAIRADSRWQMSDGACLAALADEPVRWSPWQAPDGACAVSAPVRLEATRLVLARPLATSCTMALAWVTFEHEAARLARRHLGAGLAGIEHYGSHACRKMSGNSRRMSLHASARAIDLSGFVLDDGRRISVRDDWGDWNDKGRFLEAVAKAACEHFNLVLTPAHDRAHHDHFHLDIGPWRLCGV